MGRLYQGPAPSRPTDLARLADVSGAFNPGWVANRWYIPMFGPSISTTAVGLGPNILRLVPFYVSHALSVQQFCTRITSLNSNTGNLSLLIYKHSNTLGVPQGAPVISTPNTTAAVGNITMSGGNTVLQPGWYWGGVWCNSTFTFQVFETLSQEVGASIGAAASNSLLNGLGSFSSLQYAGGTQPAVPTFTTSTAFTENYTANVPAFIIASNATG